MSTFDHIDDHEDQLRAWPISRYAPERAPRLHALLSALGLQFQEAEDTLLDLLVTRLLETATDHQLDILGRIVGERRDGLDDATYRRFINARKLIRASGGERWRLTQIVRTLTGASEIRWWATPPASFLITYRVPAPLPFASRVAARLQEATASGVRPQLCELPEGSFTWAGDGAGTEDWVGDWAVWVE